MRFIRLWITCVCWFPSIAAMAGGSDDQAKYDAAALGISPADIPTLTAEQKKATPLKFPTTKGALVRYVWSGGPADAAGLDTLDIITAVNGKKIANASELHDSVTEAGIKEIPVAYYHASEVKSGITWKQHGTKIKARSLRSLLESQIPRKVDDATGVVTYRHKDASEIVNDKNSVEASVIDDGTGKAQLKLRIAYVAKEWLFINSYIFVTPLDRLTITTPRYDSVKRDLGDGKIWEWYTASCDVADDKSPVFKVAQALASERVSKVFYIGKQYREESEVPADQQARVMMLIEYIHSHPLLKK